MVETQPSLSLDAAGRALIDKHRGWWERRTTLYTRTAGAPLGDLWLPLADGTLADRDLALFPHLLDTERLTGEQREPGNLGVYGDRFSTCAAYSRIPWVEAILGAPIRATILGGSMRAAPFVRTWEDWESTAPHWDTAWFDLLIQLTKTLRLKANGNAAVTQTLMRGPSDLAEAVLGPEMMSFAALDHPQKLESFLEEVTQTFLRIYEALLDCMTPVAGGYISAFGIWAPGVVVRDQCDASAFLSPKHYTQWYLPYDQRICRAFDYSIMHLHSCSLHTVEALLGSDYPTAIQITLETSPPGPSLKALIPVFEEILAEKPLLVEGKLTQADVDKLYDELPAAGLAITARDNAW